MLQLYPIDTNDCTYKGGNFMFGFGFDNMMFSIIPIIVTIGFIVVFGTFIVRGIQSAKTYKKNNNSPILTVDAKIITKRADVSYRTHHNNNDMDMHSSSTMYFVGFEVESGDRLEFQVTGNEYGMLVEGDKGKLTFQGTRYKEFKRI